MNNERDLLFRKIAKAPRPNSTRPAVYLLVALLLTFLSIVFSARMPNKVAAQSPAPSVTDPNLSVRTVVSGLITPVSMAFIGPNDILVLEKNTGAVKRVVNGA